MWPFRTRPARRVVLYGKPGCHLCENARALLASLGRQYRLEIDEIDITGDPELFRRYDVRIPVMVIGEITIEAPISEQNVRRALAQDAAV